MFQIHTSAIEKVIKHQHFEGKDEDGKEIKEDVEVDETDNIAKFKVTGDDGETFHVVQDFGRKLVIMKTPDEKDPKCLVSVLNTTASSKDLKEMQNMIGPDNAEKSTFVQQDAAIPQTDFLPAEARAMCEGHNVYWATEQCDGDKQVGSRSKRATCLYRRCYYWYIGYGRYYYRCYYFYARC